ncbi:Ribosomal protein S18 acetylase RimI [Cognatiyoonia koreensis]|uniref:Ribosomal protein S18 acetylase RimI n=1 Tax=Cognatiyoonia koreensis TaxID=364200 RepID=A0A1I0Q3R7_9RHOB|nr:N-acetyltransferase [Cognatiyoonia koreensis]SEW21423.1 Ribosomal protein S18 acetylase RimI [Cognatiyoonia koreensis]
MQIRAATPQDHDAIWCLLEPVFRAGDTYAVARDITRDDALTMWCELPKATFVVEDAGRIIGTYYIKTNQQGGGAHVCNCGYVTDSAAQGRGVASAMCAHSQDAARGLGYRAMQFNFVLATNTGAIRLWERAGFETVGRLPHAFDHPTAGLIDALVMFKWLDAGA